MKKVHVITGLPRSGSTLLCNILNQNPLFKATSTSPLSGAVTVLIHHCSNSPEVKGMLEKENEIAKARIESSIRAFCDAWLLSQSGGAEVVFDKSRAWSAQSMVLRAIYPDAKIILTVRDLRNIFASIEKQNKKFPLLDYANSVNEKTAFSRYQQMFSADGLVGSCLNGIDDMVNRKIKDVFYVNFETLASTPEDAMRSIYDFLEFPYYDHDFENVENTAEDPDYLYLDKFPHEGSGKVKPADPQEWSKHISNELASMIHQNHINFQRRFGYA
jgi:sulfotransferase